MLELSAQLSGGVVHGDSDCFLRSSGCDCGGLGTVAGAADERETEELAGGGEEGDGEKRRRQGSETP